ncbi:hypothetical protein D3C75_179010 [compost metagenome]
MSKTPIDIRPVIQELWGGRQPNSNFEGLYHHLEFDWSIFDTDFDSFIEKLRVLHEFIAPAAVTNVFSQLIYRILEGKEAEADFLQAVFGEVSNLSEPK